MTSVEHAVTTNDSESFGDVSTADLLAHHRTRRKNPQLPQQDRYTCTFSLTSAQLAKLSAISRYVSAKNDGFYNRSQTVRWLLDAFELPG